MDNDSLKKPLAVPLVDGSLHEKTQTVVHTSSCCLYNIYMVDGGSCLWLVMVDDV